MRSRFDRGRGGSGDYQPRLALKDKRGALLSRRALIATSASAVGLVKWNRVLADDVDVVISRGYVPCRFGQIHYHVARPRAQADVRQTPIGCLHPSPASGRYFLDLLRDLGKDRVAYAFDIPGFGESDLPPSPPGMSGYADAFSDAIKALDIGPMDLLGYHTGCSVAVEISLNFGHLVRRLCLVSVPFFDTPEKRNALMAGLDRDPYEEKGTRIFEEWKETVEQRANGVTLEQSIDAFMERLRAGDKKWWGYEAAFSYPVEDRYAKVTHPTVLLNPHGGLYDETLKAAGVMPNAELVDMPNLSHGVFQLDSPVIASAARNFLDG